MGDDSAGGMRVCRRCSGGAHRAALPIFVVLLTIASAAVQGDRERKSTSHGLPTELSREPPAWPWVTTRERMKLVMSQPSSVSVSSTPRLTTIGKKIRRVLVVELSTGGVCRSDDWYCPATLPPCSFLLNYFYP